MFLGLGAGAAGRGLRLPSGPGIGIGEVGTGDTGVDSSMTGSWTSQL